MALNPQFGFQTAPVPVQKEVPIQVRSPGMVDPARVIMEAAQMRQQRDLQNQQMQMKSWEDLTAAINSAASLNERRREFESKNRFAEIAANLAQQKQATDEKLAEAHGEYFKGMVGKTGDITDKVNRVLDKEQSGVLPPGTTMRLTSGRWGPGKMAMLDNLAVQDDINLTDPALSFAAKSQGIRTNEGATVQMRVRNYTSALPQLKTLADMVDSLPQGNFQDLNALASSLEARSGSRVANAFRTQVSRLLLTLRAASPNGTDAVLDQDAQQLNLAKSKDQLRDSIRLLFKDAVNQRNVVSGPGVMSSKMSPEESSWGLYPSEDQFGGLGNIGQQDQSPGGGMVDWLKSMASGGGQQQPQDTLSQVRAEKLRRQAGVRK